MASHESLPDGQRAILQLLLKQGKSYDELSGLLKSDPTALRQRAHEAVEAVAPRDADISSERRHEIADYLLGQQSASQRAATREYLEDSAAGRSWADAAASGLRALGGSLPEVPAEPAEVEQAFEALDRRTARQQEIKRSSQAGGRLLFAGLGLVLAIGLLWVFGAFDGGEDSAQAPTTSTATTEAPLQFDPLQTAVMKSDKNSKAKAEGIAVVARRSGTQELSLAIEARKLPASARQGSAYAVWLYTSPAKTKFTGFTPLVGKDGALQAAFELARDTPSFSEVLLTRETREKPTAPGRILLRGPLQIVPAEARTQTQPQGE